jgi:hypothetical protein
MCVCAQDLLGRPQNQNAQTYPSGVGQVETRRQNHSVDRSTALNSSINNQQSTINNPPGTWLSRFPVTPSKNIERDAQSTLRQKILSGTLKLQ